jgi:hypothetical protein
MLPADCEHFVSKGLEHPQSARLSSASANLFAQISQAEMPAPAGRVVLVNRPFCGKRGGPLRAFGVLGRPVKPTRICGGLIVAIACRSKWSW